MDKLQTFYSSKAWRDLTYILKYERGARCERCGYRPPHFSRLIGHHRIELNESNVGDAGISLNPDNIEIICITCHNKKHRRFNGNKHNVYLVYGSPFSGKADLVRELMKRGDIILDIDSLWQAVTFNSDKPNNIRFNVFKLRDCLYDQIKMRYGKWVNAYVIQTLANKHERERVAKELGAELIYCESTKEECYERWQNSGKSEAYIQYIEDWWKIYLDTPPGVDISGFAH
jgi:hypothetical protein